MSEKIGTKAVILSITRVLELLLSMIVVMLLSRITSLSEYGTYSQFISIIGITVNLFSFGLPASINYFVAKENNPSSKREFLSIFYTFITITSISAGFLLFLIQPLLVSYYNNNQLYLFSYLFFLYPWTFIIRSTSANILVVYSKFKLLMIYNLSNSVLTIFVLLSKLVFQYSFNNLLFYLFVIEVLYCFIVYAIVGTLERGITFKLNYGVIKKILNYAIPLGIASFIGTIAIQIDKLIIGRFRTVEYLAIYTNASKELPITFISASVTAVILPVVVKKIHENNTIVALEVWRESAILSYIFICFFSTIVFVYASEIITILYSNKYITGVPIFRIYDLTVLLRFTYFGLILSATGNTRKIMSSSLISLLMNLIISLLLFSWIGDIGPSIGTLIALLILAIVQMKYTTKIINKGIKEILPIKMIIYISIINIILGALFSFLLYRIRVNFNQSIYFEVVIIVIWILIYFGIFYKKINKIWKNLK